MRAAV